MSGPKDRGIFATVNGGGCPMGYGKEDEFPNWSSNGNPNRNGAVPKGPPPAPSAASNPRPMRPGPRNLPLEKIKLVNTKKGNFAKSFDSRPSLIDPEQDGVNMLADAGGISYTNYLKLDMICNAQEMQSEIHGKPVHDEHLFIIIHQTYELWFKQVLYEIDSVRNLFLGGEQLMKAVQAEQDGGLEGGLDERRMLEIIKRMDRVKMILKLLVEQIHILETMTPFDFMDFRGYLSSASGFQSLQFRLLENKLGTKEGDRVRYNQDNYNKVFDEKPDDMKKLVQSEEESSLSECVQRWLERTPGLEEDGFNFPKKFKEAVEGIFARDEETIMHETNFAAISHRRKNLDVKRDQFESIFCKEKHEQMRMRGERKFTHKALMGAIMIMLYKEETRFHQPSLLLEILMDIDSTITKWRYNHVLLVQRMLGSQQLGTGGSSGYQYLRSTLADRYKNFLDLFNVATFLIPRDDIPPLTDRMKTLLRTHSFSNNQ